MAGADQGDDARPGAGLAARFRTALQSRERERAEQQAQERAKELARAAREQLFEDLVAFAQAIGFVTGERLDDGARLSFEQREVRFAADGDADGVLVTWPERPERVEHRLYREPMLGHRWIWRYVKHGREHRLPLFDQGLELLLVESLGLPDPG